MYLNINVFKTVKLMVTQKTKIMEYKDTKFKSYTFSTYVFNIVNWNQNFYFQLTMNSTHAAWRLLAVNDSA